ncbi:hypothetical protein SMKI_06G0420 [Saccharomyces mikatae IFO 1815]|uniref:DUF3835 domain-containing protein n=1 Tax=Saccharomyces mikatae IFO 1815 TaxID=226126 RepID=A0AA35IZP4_SACMI|nr:uncharacterized protein SMKI_06G0420 [Saccharomyces mikatae IFO 1815]CAI4038696.1 hypothetical protein SMKI_06G0420 [Saccharomyces mikatae IFO 1815]
MDVLTDSVENTLKNLQSKRNFLAEQREQYINIRGRLISFSNDNDEGDGEERLEDQGVVFGDIIISASRIYLSIGYDYYVEKTKEETVAFVDDKLKLMEDAIEQFDLKIKEAKKTLDGLNFMETESGIEQEDDDDNRDFLPSMEIREELDEDGNVVSSSITPTTKKVLQSNYTQEEENYDCEKKEPPSKEQQKLNSFEENLKGKLSRKSTEVKRVVEPSQVDTESIYTFADLVRQMDQQDELEDGSIGSDEVNYDYDAFENTDFTFNEYNSEEDEDDEEIISHSIIPGFEAQSSFLKQIQQLRAQKQPQEHSLGEDKVKKPLKPILKKSSIIEKPVQKQKKKRVGFASSLDIHEVENLKDENKRQMHTIMVSTDDNTKFMGLANETTSDEFDGDLFAKMLGVQDANEVHDKYKNEMISQDKDKDETNRSNKRNKVSRFKKDRAFNKQGTPANVRFVKAKPVVSDILEEQSVVRDIIEKEPVVENMIGKSPSLGNGVETGPMTSDIIEREAATDTKDNLESALKGKKMKSLQKPRTCKLKRKKFDPTIFENISDDDDDDDKKTESNQSKGDSDEQEKFPSKIQEVSRSMIQTSATLGEKPVRITNVDYHALGGDLDDMVKAYSLGLYDDDLEDDPGTIVEKLEDFKEYNRQVELLRDEIRDFQLNNQPVVADEEEEEDEGKFMVDIVEHEYPESYTNNEDEVALHPDRLQEAVAIEYRRLKETAASKWQSSPLTTLSEGELEPIDKYGNPIKTSRFRSQRLRMDNA